MSVPAAQMKNIGGNLLSTVRSLAVEYTAALAITAAHIWAHHSFYLYIYHRSIPKQY